MSSHLDARVGLTKQFAVEEPRAHQDREQDPWLYDFDVPSDRRDFVMLMISFVIMAFGIWWVTP